MGRVRSEGVRLVDPSGPDKRRSVAVPTNKRFMKERRSGIGKKV